MDYVKLSKEISYALRHAPWEYELELDEEGFVPIEQLLQSLNLLNEYGRDVTKEDLEYIIAHSDKKRHEIVDDKIRALYGHSLPTKIEKTPGIPPDVLYHGTANRFLDSIMKDGLHPMKRQYVHLSVDVDMGIRNLRLRSCPNRSEAPACPSLERNLWRNSQTLPLVLSVYLD